MNERIRGEQVRLIGEDGEQLGIVPRTEALKRAEQSELDLVLVAPGDPPVCRLMNYSRHQYLEQKRQREARKKQAQTRQDTKVVQFRPKIAEHDYDWKRRDVIRFLQAGDRVQAQIFFRGREQAHPELGMKILDRLVGDVKEVGRPSANTTPKQEGRTINMILEPLQAKRAHTKSTPPAEDATGSPPEAPADSPADAALNIEAAAETTIPDSAPSSASAGPASA